MDIWDKFYYNFIGVYFVVYFVLYAILLDVIYYGTWEVI